jgi:enoyl-CoA hydratase/carnithine racemase
VERVGDEVIVKSEDGFTTITMNRPERRNALSLELMGELTAAFVAAGADEGRGVILAGNGPVFSAGHDFADLASADLPALERLLAACTELMTTMQAIPQPVVARVHGLATAAGCQLVATADLAVAADTASFAIPGGKGGWFCHTPLVAVARNLGRKRALEMAMTGDPIDAATAADWGLVNRVVPEDDLEEATLELLRRATRGSAASKGLGKQAFYAQVELSQTDAYRYAMDVMARAGTSPEAQEGFAAFLEKRKPRFDS